MQELGNDLRSVTGRLLWSPRTWQQQPSLPCA